MLAAIALACITVLFVLQALQPKKNIDFRPPAFEEFPQIDELLAQLKPDTSVAVLSADLAIFPTIYGHHLIWASRSPCLWMLPAIVRNEFGSTDPRVAFKRLPLQTIVSLASLERTDTAEDLDYWRPAIILIPQCNSKHTCTFLESYDFDLLAWFLQSSRFQMAWSHYRQESLIPGFAAYRRVD